MSDATAAAIAQWRALTEHEREYAIDVIAAEATVNARYLKAAMVYPERSSFDDAADRFASDLRACQAARVLLIAAGSEDV